MTILTTLQIDILKLLQESRRELNDILPEQNQILVSQQVDKLLSLGLLDSMEGADGLQYGTTESGKVELRLIDAAEKKKGGPVVPPRTYNFLSEVYVPPTNEYVRNGGNKHIPSRGLR